MTESRKEGPRLRSIADFGEIADLLRKAGGLLHNYNSFFQGLNAPE